MNWPQGLTFRPLETWPGGLTPDRRRSPFSAPLADTVSILRRELDFLDARAPVLQLALRERDLRLDGLPRVDARPSHPGVVLSFTVRTTSREFRSRGAAAVYLRSAAGVERGTSFDEAYRRAVAAHHPDRGGEHETFVRLQEAYRYLTEAEPARFATDRFLHWEENLRAIALGLEALRRVERYGIADDGEQYTGWKQLTS